MSVASEMDALRDALSEVDVLTALTRDTFGETDWTRPDPANVDVMATLIRLIDKTSFSTMQVFHRLKRAIDAQPAPAGERWDHDGRGTAPGPDEQGPMMLSEHGGCR